MVKLDARVAALEKETARSEGGGIFVVWKDCDGDWVKWDSEVWANRKLTSDELSKMGTGLVRTYGLDLSVL